MIWNIEYWDEENGKSPIKKWLYDLPKEHFIKVTKEIRLLEIIGNKVKPPHSKALGDKLFELREQKYGYRIYYGFKESKIIIILTAGDKTNQDRDIKLARKRLSQI